MKITKICKLSECNNKVKLNRNSFCSKRCYWKYLIGNTINNGRIRTEEYKQKQSLIHKGRKQTEEAKKRQIEAQMGRIVTEETRQKIAESHIGMKASDEAKQKMRIAKLDEKSPNWLGGKSFEPYGIEFNKELKQFILKRDNYKCQGLSCNLEKIKLHIHHIDYDKKNNNSDNLITLCNSCHSKTVGRNGRKQIINYYQNILINKIVECLL